MTGKQKKPHPTTRTIITAIILCAVIIYGVFLLTLPTEHLLGFMEDDGFYYLKIAENIAQGRGATFDGINPTNGFHPLWQIALVPVARLTQGNPELTVRVVLALELMLLALTIVFTALFAQRAFGGLAGPITASVFALPASLAFFLSGMEAGLLLALSSAFLLWAQRRAEKLLNPTEYHRGDFICGLFLGLIFLARLEAALLGICYFGLLLIRWLGARFPHPLRFLKKASLIASPLIILSVPYLMYNYITFGHILTISSAIKHQNILPWAEKGTLITALPLYSVGAIILTIWLVVFLTSNAHQQIPLGIGIRKAICSRRLLAVFSAVGVLRYLDGLIYTDLQFNNMGYALLLLPCALVIAAVAEGMRRWGLRSGMTVRGATAPWLMLIVILGSAVNGCWQKYHTAQYRWYGQAYQTAKWAELHLPSDVVIGANDAGILSYFCARRVVNLDGLVNNYQYQERLRLGELGEYLKEQGITHIADVALFNQKLPADGSYYHHHEYIIVSRLHRTVAGVILFSSSAELYRSRTFHAGAESEGTVIIWRIGANTPLLAMSEEKLSLSSIDSP